MHELAVPPPPTPTAAPGFLPEGGDAALAAMAGIASETDEVLLNLDASLRVHSRPQFFSWTQGLLQNLIHHRILVCVLPAGTPDSMFVDSFSMNVAESNRFCALFGAGGFGRQLIRTWTERRFRPVAVDARTEVPDVAWKKEFEKIGVTRLYAHGMHDARGGMASFFLFGCEPAAREARYSNVAELAMPFLHAAWMRTRLNAVLREGDDPETRPESGVLTVREREILRWIYFGKSNFEIGAILGISPLTVKNHVQKILRKLNVVNRAQAVGKALERRLIEP